MLMNYETMAFFSFMWAMRWSYFISMSGFSYSRGCMEEGYIIDKWAKGTDQDLRKSKRSNERAIR